MILTATFIVGALSVIYFYLKTKRKVCLAEKFPGPQAHPIFGNLLNFNFDDSLDAKHKISEGHKLYGSIYRIALIRDYQFMVCDPKIYEKVLSSTTHYIKKHIAYDFLKPWLRNGLLTSSNKYWRKHRKIITPAFHFKILEQFVEIFDRQCQIMINKLSKCCDGNAVDIVEYLKPMALDIISETAMGTEINAQTDTNSQYVKAVENVSRLITMRMFSVWRHIDFLYATIGYKEKCEQEKHIRVMHEFTNQIIVKRREYLINKQKLEKSSVNQPADDEIVQNKKNVFLDVLLQSTNDGKPLTNEEILEETDTFMFTGHDTTTYATSAILFALSRHKHVQDKLANEVVGIFGANKNVGITCRQLNELKYMDLVIKETLRYYPVVAGIGRYVDKDIVLALVFWIETDDGRVIPAGINITLNIDITLNDPKYFKDPSIFDPERFSAENNNEKQNPFTFIPFSAGLRNCIGQKYAILDLKTVITKVLLNFELLPVGDSPIITYELVSKALNGMQLGLKPREF